jgi:UDP-4-amino-4,6-dideoxy-N-acetyl-beta-L-altrosamine transaminase
MPKHSIPYGRQHITDEDIQAVVDVLKSDYLTQGPKVQEFEEAFAEYVGAKYAVAVNNGTAALHLANLVMGVQPGKKVITTPITFAATANAVLYCGGEVDFVDIEPGTYLPDLDKLAEKLKNSLPGTYAGVIPVDFAGLPVNTEKLRQIADEYGLWIIEDACHAPGGYFIDSKGEKIKCGSNAYTDLTTFSFHPVKHIAAGEGGMITTNSEAIYEKLIRLRTHGITKKNLNHSPGGWYYEMAELGYNYRLSDIHAALALSQLKKAEKGLARRRAIAAQYQNMLSDIPGIKTQHVPQGFGHAWHLFVIEVAERKELYDYLKAQGIYVQVHYIPVHLLIPYQKKGWQKDDFFVAEKYYKRCLSLPMYPSLSIEEQDFTIAKIAEYYNG